MSILSCFPGGGADIVYVSGSANGTVNASENPVTVTITVPSVSKILAICVCLDPIANYGTGGNGTVMAITGDGSYVKWIPDAEYNVYNSDVSYHAKIISVSGNTFQFQSYSVYADGCSGRAMSYYIVGLA